LHDAGIPQIIPPINTTQGQPHQQIDNSTLIVYPFIDGEDGFHRNLSDNQWITLGQALRQVHELEIPLSIQNQVRRENYSSKWRDAVRSLDKHFEAAPIDNDIALKMIKFIQENRAVIHQLMDRVEHLSQIMVAQSSSFVLCHTDIHGGNVLIDKNDMLYIVDWDEPMMAPKERDLMFIGAGVANVWNKPQEEALFYQGYGKTKVNMTILAYYRHERIVEDIALYCQALLLTAAGGDNRKVMYQHFIDMFKPRGVIDIALHTEMK
jgi:spectinomycin phosphotransferase